MECRISIKEGYVIKPQPLVVSRSTGWKFIFFGKIKEKEIKSIGKSVVHNS